MLYTVQLARIKGLPPRTQVIDVSVQSSRPPWNTFAPTWELVKDLKEGRITENQYTERYIDLMRYRFKNVNKSVFYQLIEMAMNGDVALVCYCPPETFCHRHLLKNILLKIEPKLQYEKEDTLVQVEQIALF